MARPWKHPKSGIYWLRKGVPDDLRKIIGKREEKLSLRTRDVAEAKRIHADALAKLEARWAKLRASPEALTEREAHLIAAGVHDRWIAAHINNPSQQNVWNTKIGPRVFAPAEIPLGLTGSEIMALRLDPEYFRIHELERWCLVGAEDLLKHEGLHTTDENRLVLAKACAAAFQRASSTLEKLAKGEAPDTSVFHGHAKLNPNAQKPISFDELIKGWTSERKPVEKTIYEWSRVVRQFVQYLGHDDASRVTADDVVGWKRSMIEADLRPKTIQDAKLAPMRAIMQWGVQNKLLPNNPADGVAVVSKSNHSEKKRSFTDEEARIILAAANAESDPVRRWVPWIGAYTGARVSEICQLRAEDVLQVEGVWCLKLDPSAGSLKTSGSERLIPVHPALSNAGFLKFTATIRSGPLFAELSPDKFGKRGGNGTKTIGRFVRGLGITDPRLSPSHSWRHRIKTLGRRHGLAQDILDALTGHGRRSVADSYGEFPVEALHREICKIPELRLKS